MLWQLIFPNNVLCNWSFITCSPHYISWLSKNSFLLLLLLYVPSWTASWNNGLKKKDVLVQFQPSPSFQLLCCWSVLAFLCRRSWGQLSLTNRDPSAIIFRRQGTKRRLFPLISFSQCVQAFFLQVSFQGHWVFASCSSPVFSNENILYILF